MLHYHIVGGKHHDSEFAFDEVYISKAEAEKALRENTYGGEFVGVFECDSEDCLKRKEDK